MAFFHQLLIKQPLLALFITIALGYLIGKFRIKRFVLGGIAGSLLVGVLIGQLKIQLPEAIGNIFFALFIYAVGYQGGPLFFRSLNRQTLVQLTSASLTCLLGLMSVLLAAWLWGLDRGTAAGLAAGGLTQSAIIGTAGDAIANLDVTSQVKHVLQSNVAVGYAVCYLFGSFGPILLLASVFPAMMKWDLRHEAKQLAKQQKGQAVELEPGQFNALRKVVTRVFQIADNSTYLGQSALAISKQTQEMTIEALMRNHEMIAFTGTVVLQAGDVIAVTAKLEQFFKHGASLGLEISPPKTMQVIEEKRDVVITQQQMDKKTIEQCINQLTPPPAREIFVTAISRLGDKLAADSQMIIKKGDEIQLLGQTSDLDKISPQFGYALPAAKLTDFIFFGFGMALGVLLGMINFHLAGIEITLGSGVGCLFSGLLFGWLRSTHPRFAALPQGASNFLRDFGLAVFVATIGITAGPQAITTIKQYGMELFFLGIGVTIIPQILSFYFSYYVLKIKNPIILLSTIAGGRSANPGFAALLDKAGNSTPVVPFTATYAIANILLTLWGPLIIGLITTNP